MMKTPSTGEIVERFCGLVEDEAERQETLLAVCRAQQEAALANDVQQLEAKTAALTAVVRDATEAEKERSRLLALLGDCYGLPAGQRTLTHLAPMTPEPWKSRLLEGQYRLRLATKSSRGFVRSTSRTLRWSMRAVNVCMKAMNTALGASSHVYGSGGALETGTVRRPAFVDQKG